jgi:hypothetical protein
MTLAPAIERNRIALVALAASIAALIGGNDGPLARALRNAALALLRPAEAAARRLILVAARGFAVTPGAPRPPFQGIPLLFAGRQGACGRVPAFPLFDRWKRFRPLFRPVPRAGVPRIRIFRGALPTAPSPAVATPAMARPADPDAPVDARRLRLRLASLEAALADLPRQARRLRRRLARLKALGATAPGTIPRSPLRPGRPPGWRGRADRDVDLVLRECHALACEALRPDTS